MAVRLLSRHGMSKRYRGRRIRRRGGAPPGIGRRLAARACRRRVHRPASGEPAKPVAGAVQPGWLATRRLGRRRRSAPAGAHLCRPARPSFAGHARTCAPVPRPSREPHPSGGGPAVPIRRRGLWPGSHRGDPVRHARRRHGRVQRDQTPGRHDRGAGPERRAVSKHAAHGTLPTCRWITACLPARWPTFWPGWWRAERP